jgi:hypothetical protein
LAIDDLYAAAQKQAQIHNSTRPLVNIDIRQATTLAEVNDKLKIIFKVEHKKGEQEFKFSDATNTPADAYKIRNESSRNTLPVNSFYITLKTGELMYKAETHTRAFRYINVNKVRTFTQEQVQDALKVQFEGLIGLNKALTHEQVPQSAPVVMQTTVNTSSQEQVQTNNSTHPLVVTDVPQATILENAFSLMLEKAALLVRGQGALQKLKIVNLKDVTAWLALKGIRNVRSLNLPVEAQVIDPKIDLKQSFLSQPAFYKQGETYVFYYHDKGTKIVINANQLAYKPLYQEPYYQNFEDNRTHNSYKIFDKSTKTRKTPISNDAGRRIYPENSVRTEEGSRLNHRRLNQHLQNWTRGLRPDF